MATRSGWDDLTPAYRSRLIGAGRSGKLTGRPIPGDPAVVEHATRTYWESGGTLRRGLGRQVAPTYAAPAEATARESVGLGDAGTYAELERWRARPPSRGGPPAWLPKDPEQLGTDVAAILSQIDVHPRYWRSVELAFVSGGEVVVTITPGGRYRKPRVITLPDATAVEQFGRLIKSPALMARNRSEAARLQREWVRKQGDGIEVSTVGYRNTGGKAA